MGKFFLSTTADDAAACAREFGIGLEIADFCYARNLDEFFDEVDCAVRKSLCGVEDAWFHAPFAELCPAAIDLKVRAVVKERYRQAISAAMRYGIHRIVIHGNFIPQVYYPAWFVSESVSFWKDFLSDAPENILIALENVMEPEPSLLRDIVQAVDDPRLRLCLDVGHANLTPTPLSRWISECAPWLAHMHIHNNDGKTDRHDPLDHGVMDMKTILQEAMAAAPGATFTVENQHCRESARFLKELNLI